MTGIQIFCEGLSSDFTKPTERVTTLEVRQRMKRMLNIIAEVDIASAKKLFGIGLLANPKP